MNAGMTQVRKFFLSGEKIIFSLTNFKEALQVQTDFSFFTFLMPRNWDIKMPETLSIS